MYIKFLLFIGVSSLTFAQIGINKTTINANSVFETSATDQGILIPRIPVVKNLTDKTFLNLPAETLPDGLLIYCEGGSGSIGSGYYFWQNNQWNYILDLKNLQNRIDITRLYTATTTGNTPGIVKNFYKNLSKSNSSEVETIPQLDYNNSLSVARWTAIPETEVDFQIAQTDNTITLTTYGNAQTGSNSYINTVSDYSSRTLTFNIGIFIKAKGADDSAYRLYSVGSFANSARKACLVTPFTVSTVINLSQAGNYTAKVFALGRRNSITKTNNHRADYFWAVNESNTTYGNAGNYTYLTVGGKSSGSGNQGENNGSCTNTDKLTMGTTLNILVSEVTPKN
ncbi:hypothetical protein [Empedobacter brevis]|uniref:hypothetical protein n=1 Tax=Empedobacter brevis TaxID=247 RepID=UPI002FE287DF